MTTFTTIPNSSLEPGKPIRSIDGLALRDNPLAMFEGDASAPRLVGKAVKRLQEMPVLTVSAADTYDASFGSAPVSLLTSTFSTSYVVAQRYTIANYTGSLRFKASHTGADDGSNNYIFTGYLALYKNNILIQEYSKTGGTFTQRTNDVTVAPGDVLEWRIRVLTGGTTTLFGSPLISGSDAYTTRPAYISQLDNLNP